MGMGMGMGMGLLSVMVCDAMTGVAPSWPCLRRRNQQSALFGYEQKVAGLVACKTNRCVLRRLLKLCSGGRVVHCLRNHGVELPALDDGIVPL